MRELKSSKRLSSETSRTALRTNYDVRSALSATPDADRVFQTLHSVGINEGALQSRLADVRRKNLSCCRRTVHIESRAIQRGLNCHALLTLQHVLLGLASRHKHRCRRQKHHVTLFHNDTSIEVAFSVQQATVSGFDPDEYRTLGQ
jgi:hypothetical protein